MYGGAGKAWEGVPPLKCHHEQGARKLWALRRMEIVAARGFLATYCPIQQEGQQAWVLDVHTGGPASP